MTYSEQVIWTDPDGNKLVLNGGANITILKDRVGLDNVPYQLVTEKTPGIPGSNLISVIEGERAVSLPILVTAPSVPEYLSVRRGLNSFFDPTKGRGTLSWYAIDGTLRTMYLYYEDGLRGDDTQANVTWSEHTLHFKGLDPYWYGSLVTLNYGISGAEGGSFLTDPFLPLNISESTVVASPAITQAGDKPAWPIIQIEGPGDNIIIENLTTNKRLALTRGSGLVLATGETILITSNPKLGSTVIDAVTEENLFKYLTLDSEFFPLEQGLNNLDIQMANADDNTSIQIRYYPTYSIK